MSPQTCFSRACLLLCSNPLTVGTRQSLLSEQEKEGRRRTRVWKRKQTGNDITVPPISDTISDLSRGERSHQETHLHAANGARRSPRQKSPPAAAHGCSRRKQSPTSGFSFPCSD